MIMQKIGMQIILLSKLQTWQLNDISKGPMYKNNYIKALKSIKS